MRKLIAHRSLVIGKRLIIGFILILSAISYELRATYAEPDRASMARAEKLFLQGRYERAVSELDSLIDMRASGRGEIYYLKGLSLLKLKRYGQARESFEKIIGTYQRSRRMFDAHLGIGDSCFLEGDIRQATRHYQDILAKYPNDENIVIVRRRLDDCGQNARGAAEKPLVTVKPATPAGPKGSFSVQVGSFKNRSNAERLVKKLSAKGYNSFAESYNDSSRIFYRVRVGRFSSKDQAEREASRLKALGYKTKISADESFL